MSPAKQKRRRKRSAKSTATRTPAAKPSKGSTAEPDESPESDEDGVEAGISDPGSDPGDLDDDEDLDDEDDDLDEDDADGDDEASVKRPKRAKSEQPSGILRMLFYGIWVLALPATLAVVAVNNLKPGPNDVEVGAIRGFVAGQQVPATILLFTLFAVVLWRLRHRLPLAATCGILLRADVPAGLRARYENAVQLLGDAQRILVDNKSAIKKRVKPAKRRKLEDALARLEEEVDASKVDGKRLNEAYEHASELVHEVLGAWHKGELREYAESIGVAVAVALILRFFVIEAFKIPSGSMIPTLMVGDHIFVAKYSYGPLLPRSDTRLYENMPPDRGDVMVFKYPENKKQDFIKRVVALPGDKLEVLSGRPIINGLLLPNCYVGQLNLELGSRGHLYLEHLGDKSYLTMYEDQHTSPKCSHDRDCGVARACRSGVCGVLQGPYRVKKREAWVMGDNRNNSHDSRSWRGGMGAGVPFENIKGRAMFVWWSMAPRRGFAMERMFVNVMGPPRLPANVPADLSKALADCQRKRPPIAETTPPAP